ncbi:hypothetical protein niasHS_016138 [Heterodera schachtii]|uniref:Fido domain-containing protein n=1 Tax=Heterodera schachtii TaxID=97005 RepID=A0ABD2HTX0_HETSC
MHNQHAAAQREAQRAAAMRRWPLSLFLVDSSFYHLLASPEINRGCFSIERELKRGKEKDGKGGVIESGKLEREVKREKEKDGKTGVIESGKLEREVTREKEKDGKTGVIESGKLEREVIRMFNHAILWDENQAEAGAIREHGRMFVGGFEVTPGTRIGGFEMVPDPMVRRQSTAFLSELNDRFLNATNFVELAVWAHHEVVRIHPFFDGNGRTARLFLNLICAAGWDARRSRLRRSGDRSITVLPLLEAKGPRKH